VQEVDWRAAVGAALGLVSAGVGGALTMSVVLSTATMGKVKAFVEHAVEPPQGSIEIAANARAWGDVLAAAGTLSTWMTMIQRENAQNEQGEPGRALAVRRELSVWTKNGIGWMVEENSSLEILLIDEPDERGAEFLGPNGAWALLACPPQWLLRLVLRRLGS
jgi:hypothetical protein